MGDTYLWIGRRVYIKLKNSGRVYSGLVLDENKDILTIRDIKEHLVRISKSEIGLLQEETR